MAISSELEQLLAEWLPRQSWFPVLESELGTDPDLAPMSDTLVFELDLPLNTYNRDTLTARGTVAIVAVGEGSTLRRISVPLTFRTIEEESLRPNLIGTIDDFMLGTCWVYDAVADPLFVLFAATAMANGNAEFALGAGAAFTDFEPSAGLGASVGSASAGGGGSEDQPTQLISPAAREFNALTAEPTPQSGAMSVGESAGRQLTASKVGQGGPEFRDLQHLSVLWHRASTTNIELFSSRSGETTVIVHDHAFPSVITFFRVLGIAKGKATVPESVRLPVALTQSGSHTVPPVLGWLAGRWYDGHDLATYSAPIAMLTRNEPTSQTAWADAVETVLEVNSSSVGSFNRRGSELGSRVGELHVDLANEFGLVEGVGEPTTEWVAKWSERIDWALARAPLALGPLSSKLRAHQKNVKSMRTLGSLQRIHGGLTLNQVRKSPVTGYTVVNFTNDGEPKPPAFDLVALLRSLDYAAGYARLERIGAFDPEAPPSTMGATGLIDDEAISQITEAPETLWSHQAQNALLSGYAHATGASVSLSDPVLRAVLIDRLLVETVSELRNRPAWLVVPLSALMSVLGDGATVNREPSRLVAPEAPELETSEPDITKLSSGSPVPEDAPAAAPAEAPAVARASVDGSDQVGTGDAAAVDGTTAASKPFTESTGEAAVTGADDTHVESHEEHAEDSAREGQAPASEVEPGGQSADAGDDTDAAEDDEDADLVDDDSEDQAPAPYGPKSARRTR